MNTQTWYAVLENKELIALFAFEDHAYRFTSAMGELTGGFYKIEPWRMAMKS